MTLTCEIAYFKAAAAAATAAASLLVEQTPTVINTNTSNPSISSSLSGNPLSFTIKTKTITSTPVLIPSTLPIIPSTNSNDGDKTLKRKKKPTTTSQPEVIPPETVQQEPKRASTTRRIPKQRKTEQSASEDSQINDAYNQSRHNHETNHRNMEAESQGVFRQADESLLPQRGRGVVDYSDI